LVPAVLAVVVPGEPCRRLSPSRFSSSVTGTRASHCVPSCWSTVQQKRSHYRACLTSISRS
jgi:hypothetical protein